MAGYRSSSLSDIVMQTSWSQLRVITPRGSDPGHMPVTDVGLTVHGSMLDGLLLPRYYQHPGGDYPIKKEVRQ